MSNNKGFTLVELIVVILILVSVSLVAVSGITASLERQHIEECEGQKQIAINAAKIYFSLTDTNSVTVGTLINNDYFVSDEVNRLSTSDTISIGTSSYNYSGTSCE